MVALEISTQRRSSKHQPGNASVDPTFESRECPVECRNHQEVCGQASGRNGQVPNVVDLPAKSPASVLGNGLFHGSYASLANPLHLCDFESFPSASVHFAVTAHPTTAWVIQQLREAMPFGQQPSYLFRDNDGIYGDEVGRFLAGTGIEEVKTAHRCP